MAERKPEQKAWDTFKRNSDISRELRFWRIENLHGDGMSDVYGINRRGTSMWLEFKALKQWPARATTKPLAKVFEPGQIPYLKEICSYKGVGRVVLRVEEWDEWFLLHPKLGELEIVDMTRTDIEIHSVATGLTKILSHLSYI